MRAQADYSLEQRADGQTVLALRGPLTVSAIAALDGELRALPGGFQSIDLAQVTSIDTVGAWLVQRTAVASSADIINASRDGERLIAALAPAGGPVNAMADRLPLIPRVTNTIGESVTGWMKGAFGAIGFLGSVVSAMGNVIAHPSRFRGKALVRQLELVGVNSLGIIGLMSFLVGIVIAQQGAVQLRQFGAEIYTINLTGRLAFRELGVLMTAIMVAGRSGSAFAAQIGTMKLTEEVDAMRTIGVSPVEALVIPRVLACTFMMILLGFYAAILAIIGGATISTLTLDIPMMTFLNRIREVVPIHDLYVGLVKAPVFGLIVALAGCYQGMRVEGNAEQVGLRTTDAVVQAIFMVIVLDAFFAVFFTWIGWS